MNAFADLIPRRQQAPPPAAAPAERRPNRFLDLVPQRQPVDPQRFDDAFAPDADPGRTEGLQRRVTQATNPSAPAAGLGSVIQGITAGFGDEIAGVFGGIMDTIGFGPKGGEGTFSEGYGRTRDYANTNRRLFEAANPVAATALEGAGALATLPVAPQLTILKAARAAPAGARLATRAAKGLEKTGRAAVNAAATGAAYGAAYGAGTADGGLGERAEGALKSGAIGAGLGAGGSLALRALGGGARAVGALPYVRRVAQGIRGVTNPEREAARRVVSSIESDTGAPVSQAMARMRAGQARGAPLVIADTGQVRTRALARSAANTSPEGRQALERATQPRFETQNLRAEQVIRNLVRTPANATMTREAIEDAMRTAREPFYRRAYARGAGGILDNELTALSRAPEMQRAIVAAEKSIANKQASGRAMSPLSPSGQPTLEFWDQVKRNLDSAYSVARRGGDKELAADLDALRKALVRKLDKAVPEYATARGVSAELFKADDALTAGEEAVTSRMSNSEIARGLAKMSPEEKMLFREGYVSSYLDRVLRTNDRRSILNAIEANPQARRRTEIVLGRQARGQLDNLLRVEAVMDRLRTEVTGNSKTAQYLSELGLAGGLGSLGGGFNPIDPSTYGNLPAAIFTGLLVAGARRGGLKIDQRVARRVGELLASRNPVEFEKAIKLVAGNEKLGKLIRYVDDAISRTGTVATAGKPSLEIANALENPDQ